jgi:thiol-disulfide isomerase/thioredoxin
MKRIISTLVLLFLFAVAASAQSPPSKELNLRDLRGRTLRLSDYKGKLVLLNFWATWCIPCRTEIPDLIKLQKEYRNEGLRVIGITYPPEKLSAVRRFTQKLKVSYRVALGTTATRLYLLAARRCQ